MPLVERRLDERHEPTGARVRNHRVDALVLVHGCGERALDVLFDRHVAASRRHSRPIRPRELLQRRSGLLLVPTPDLDCRAGIEQRLREAESQPTVSTRDDRDTTVEPAGHRGHQVRLPQGHSSRKIGLVHNLGEHSGEMQLPSSTRSADPGHAVDAKSEQTTRPEEAPA